MNDCFGRGLSRSTSICGLPESLQVCISLLSDRILRNLTQDLRVLCAGHAIAQLVLSSLLALLLKPHEAVIWPAFLIHLAVALLLFALLIV